jgi:DNA-binding NarL/FixJ family response regulator
MQKKVFIVEDDSVYAEFIKSKLKRSYSIYSFNNAEDCLQSLKSIKPDVLVLDYYLPGMNGIDLYEKTKDDLPEDTKVIILSSLEDGKLVLDFIKKGIRDYIVKDDKVIESLIAIIEDEEDTYLDSLFD